MTNTQTLVNRSNRRGNYITKLFFIEVNDSIISGLHTEYIDNRFEDGSIKDGRIYFNDLEGKFLVAYRITEGVLSYRMNYKQQQIQQASFLSFLLLLQTSTISEDFGPCWNTDNIPNEIDVVDLGTIGGGGGGNTSDGFDIATYWLYTNNEDDDPNNNYQYYYGSGGSGNTTTTTVPCAGGKIRNATTNECECPDGKIEDSTGNCIDACTDGKILNANDNCVSPECLKITNRINPSFRQKLIDLRETTDQNIENSISIYQDGTQENFTGVVGLDGIAIPSIVPSPYVTYSHTHDSYGIGSGTLSVFSMADLITLADILDKGNLNAGTFVAFLATDDDTEYALTISDPIKFINLFFAYIGAGIDQSFGGGDFLKYLQSKKKVENLFWEYFDLDNPDRKLKEDSTDTENDLKEFLNFMNDADMGVKLFESNDTFEVFNQVNWIGLNGNNTILRTPCN